MLERPDVQDQHLISRLLDEYDLQVDQVTFLPLGADVNTAVFKVVTQDGAAYFLKLRKGDFSEITVTVPQFLRCQGIYPIIAPLETRARQLWVSLDEYKMILYTFIDGKDGYEVALSDQQWQDFGVTLKRIHTVKVPPDLARLIPRETFSPYWREIVQNFQALVEETAFEDPTAAKLVEFMQSRRGEIDRLVSRGEALGSELQTRPLQMVLCHADLHAGNLLISEPDEFYVVDWDNPIFAPKEKDLALIGGSAVWNSSRIEALFYQGYLYGSGQRNLPANSQEYHYGADYRTNPYDRRDVTNVTDQVVVDSMVLAYYRCERIIQDIAAYCQQLLLTDEGGEDRLQSLAYFTGQFLPGHEVDIAFRTIEKLNQ